MTVKYLSAGQVAGIFEKPLTIMGHIICISSQKGGTGKTTTAINLSAALAMAEKMTLLVDCDPQGNATSGMGIDKAALSKHIYHFMMGYADPDEVLIETAYPFLKTIPARIELFRAEVELMSKPGKEKILQKVLGLRKKHFDYIIIDPPPSLGLLTVNTIVAADMLLIPLQCEYFALEGFNQLLKVVRMIKKKLNPGLRIIGVLLSMLDEGEKVSLQIAREIRNNLKEMVFKTIIPRNRQLREAPLYGMPLLLKDKPSGGSYYLELASEIIKRTQEMYSFY